MEEIIKDLLQEIRGLRIEVSELREEVSRNNDLTCRQANREVVSVTEAAAMAGKSRQTISGWIRKGILPKVSKGGKRGVLKADILRVRRCS